MKSVIVYSYEQQKILKFPSISKASEHIGVTERAVRKALKSKTGYTGKHIVAIYESDLISKVAAYANTTLPIACIHPKGHVIDMFLNTLEANMYVECTPENLTYAALSKTKSCGYFWKFVDKETYEIFNIAHKRQLKPIIPLSHGDIVEFAELTNDDIERGVPIW